MRSRRLAGGPSPSGAKRARENPEMRYRRLAAVLAPRARSAPGANPDKRYRTALFGAEPLGARSAPWANPEMIILPAVYHDFQLTLRIALSCFAGPRAKFACRGVFAALRAARLRQLDGAGFADRV